jgi:hypothetical protein
MRYEIDDDFAIRIYHVGDDVPFLFQPDYPNLDKFDSRDEAEQWALATIEALNNPNALNAPSGKGLIGTKQSTLTIPSVK